MSLANTSASDANKKEVSNSNTAFALDLFLTVRQEQDQPDNIFFSPFSITSALAITAAGAVGTTQQELYNALKVTLPEEQYHPAFGFLLHHLGVDDPSQLQGVELAMANRLWVEQRSSLKSDYLALTSSYYAAKAENADFHGHPEEERQRINKWVSDQTKTLIQNLLPKNSITSDTHAVITNAIYFKGTWYKAFDPQSTTSQVFTKLDGSIQENVPLMHLKQTFRYKATDEFTAVELPYGPRQPDQPPHGADLSMIVILPAENTVASLNAIPEKLKGRGFKSLVDQMFPLQIEVYLPRFKLENSIDLTGIMQKLGVNAAFGAADFSKMSDTPLSISAILHKAFVNVNEEGTEAAAATAVIMKRSMAIHPDPVFRADRPFFFFIWDRNTRTVLFVGQCTHPQ